MKKRKISFTSILLIITISFLVGFLSNGLLNKYLNKNAFSDEQIDMINMVGKIINDDAIEVHQKDKLVDYALKGMAAALNDEYAYYFTAEELDDYVKSTNGVVEGGIGASLYFDGEKYIFPEVYKGLAAYSSGILPGDELIKVNGESIEGLSLEEIVSKVKGEAGTEVNITVIRDGKELAFNVVRSNGQRELVEYKMIDSILYTRIISFHGNAVEYFSKALEYGKSNNYDGIIIDLRDNPGGELEVFVQIADYLLEEGEVFYALDKNGNKILSERSNAGGVDKEICVIVNGDSASASEALCGALRDLGNAKIVGTKTFGKGIMQSNYTLPNGGMFKLTTAKYYLPNGDCIQGEGITPDYVVELPESLRGKIWMLNEEDIQLKKAVEVLTE